MFFATIFISFKIGAGSWSTAVCNPSYIAPTLICAEKYIKFLVHFCHLLIKVLNDISCKVGILGVVALWYDFMAFPADQG